MDSHVISGPVQLRGFDLFNAVCSFENVSYDGNALHVADGSKLAYIILDLPAQHYPRKKTPDPKTPYLYGAGPTRLVFQAGDGALPQTVDDLDLHVAILTALRFCTLVRKSPGGSFTTLEAPYAFQHQLIEPGAGYFLTRPTITDDHVTTGPVSSLQIHHNLGRYSNPITWRPASGPVPKEPHIGNLETLQPDQIEKVIEIGQDSSHPPLNAFPLAFTGRGATTRLSIMRPGVPPGVSGLGKDDANQADSFTLLLGTGEDNFREYSTKIHAWPARNWMSLQELYRRLPTPPDVAGNAITATFRFLSANIRINQPDVAFTDADARALGFRHMRLDTPSGSNVSPAVNMQKVTFAPGTTLSPYTIYRAYLASDPNQEFGWKVHWTDHAGNVIPSTDLYFPYLDPDTLQAIGNAGTAAVAALNDLFKSINGSHTLSVADVATHGSINFNRQSVQMVDSVNLAPPDLLPKNITFPLDTLDLAGQIVASVAGRPEIIPRALTSYIVLPAASAVLGSASVLPYRFNGLDLNGQLAAGLSYCTGGISATKAAGLFADIVTSGIPAIAPPALPGDAQNAIASLSAVSPHLSATLGAINATLQNPAAYAQGISLKDALPDLSDAIFSQTKILGLMTLKDLLSDVMDSTNFLGDLPRFVQDNVTGTTNSVRMACELVLTADAKTTKIVAFQRDQSGKANLRIVAEVQLTGGSLHRRVTFDLPPIIVRLIDPSAPLVAIYFDRVGIVFDSTTGLSVNARVIDVKFPTGLMSALSALDSALSGAQQDVINDLAALEIALHQHVPDITMGAFALRNLKFKLGVKLPRTLADLEPSLDLAIADPLDQFSLSVGFYTGWGSYALTIEKIITKRTFAFSGSLAFGASLAIDLGVASGCVYAKAGFNYLSDPDNQKFFLEAFLEIGGSLSILDIISINAFFHLTIGYYEDGNRHWYAGDAWLHVDISFFFFSFSADVRCHREFGGGSSGLALSTLASSAASPSLADWITAPQWLTYCSAFDEA